MKRILLFIIASIVVINAKTTNREIIVWSDKDLGNHISNDNTIYNVKGPVDLQGKVWFFGQNCELKITTGSIFNGYIRGDNTTVEQCRNNSLGVKFQGTWNVPVINDSFFIQPRLTDNEIIENINILQSKDTHNKIYLKKKRYYLTIEDNGGYALRLFDNADCYIQSRLYLNGNDHDNYSIISLSGASNVTINGGKIYGDVGNHKYRKDSSSEWGMGITVMASSNINIEDVYVTGCTGDGIYIGGYPTDYIADYSNASKNVVLRNVTSDANRRQGLSVIAVDGLLVENCSFINTGKVESTPPSAGIDIEPNVSEGRNNSVRNILIKNCSLKGNKGYSFEAELSVSDGTLFNYENVVVENCVADGPFFIGASDVKVKNTKMESVIIRPYEAPMNPVFDGCKIVGRGVTILEPHEHKSLYRNKKNSDPLLSVLFSNCRIKFKPVSKLSTARMITIDSTPDVVSSVTFESCRMTYRKSVLSSDIISNKKDVKVSYKNCVLKKTE